MLENRFLFHANIQIILLCYNFEEYYYLLYILYNNIIPLPLPYDFIAVIFHDESQSTQKWPK